ncbi:MAG: redox-sensing transcriptional repressor Rex [Firmicutes bacterium HGW-Firmicutes-7]|nr:MAG: redox-sensing transcriptional repressor Rex [Firmicutes bacterium HGW-Firmicutes-7]
MLDQNSRLRPISKIALQRLPYYLNYLKKKQKEAVKNISAPMIANGLSLNEVQVRKDLAIVSANGGKPKTGYVIDILIGDLEKFLGYDNVNQAVLVGVGQLGKALLSYKGFDDYGLEIVAAFDTDQNKLDLTINDKCIFHMDKLKDLCERLKIHIGIITVSAVNAQAVCDQLIECGVLAVWNFAPVHLKVPEHILVQDENMASSLAVLSRHLAETIEKTN